MSNFTCDIIQRSEQNIINTYFFKSINLFVLLAAFGVLNILHVDAKEPPLPFPEWQAVHRDIVIPHMTLTPELLSGMFLDRLWIDISVFKSNEIETLLMPWDKYIATYSAHYSVPPDLVRAIIYTESKGKQFAVSRAGAQGLMQLMPVTSNSMGVKNPFDPEENIKAGVKYIAWLVKNGNLDDDSHLLWAWNAGPSIRRKKYIPGETMEFIIKVLSVKRFLEESSPVI